NDAGAEDDNFRLADDGKRPNIWARGVNFETAEKDDQAGLESPEKWTSGGSSSETSMAPVVKRTPKHTLGFFNNRGERGTVTRTDDGTGRIVSSLTPNPNAGYVGIFANTTGDSTYDYASSVPLERPFWNDAPYSAPYELAFVPACAPGRFGLEFIRSGGKEIDYSDMYDADGASLGGKVGVYGYSHWGKADGERGRSDNGVMGPYLNFFASSHTPGETLNLSKIFDFVQTSSRYLGTKKLASNAEGGWVTSIERDKDSNVITDNNVVFQSARREPGKVNINTTTAPVWAALSTRSGGLPGTPWSGDDDGEFDLESARGFGLGSSLSYYFKPAHATPLWASFTMDSPQNPSFSTLFADNNSGKMDPQFDNAFCAKALDDAGNPVYVLKRTIDVVGERGMQLTEDNVLTLINDGTLTWDDVEYKTVGEKRRGLYDSLSEMTRLSGLVTTRSNAFAVWVTVGYFEVERCKPGVNMPDKAPNGDPIAAHLFNPNATYYNYYRAIYPDGFTYGKELGAEYGEMKRHRGFAIIDRSIPVDYRRGQSLNYQNAILLQRVLD
ncbi:MAG: hypothetical protein HUK22_02900, partial [Thermoguttaceae bacterium]|nr:hypothetical protein [Thermoguttaceae bacterium]